MPKQKTHKGMSKRYKVTATGKVKSRGANRGHLKSGKTPKYKRQTRNDPVMDGVRAKVIIEGLRPSL